MPVNKSLLGLILLGCAWLSPWALAEKYPATYPSTPMPAHSWDRGQGGPLADVAPNESRLDERQELLGQHHRPTIIGPDPDPATIGAMAAVPPPGISTPHAMGVVAPLVDIDAVQPLSDIATDGRTSTVTEPSIASRGNEILYTGNWFASFSTDGGQNFNHVDPWAEFPAANDGFCCDQVALYDPANDMMIWFLQYIEDGTSNTARVAVATGNDIATRNWDFYDFTPAAVGGWSNEWFDYPELALSDDHLYLTTNAFSTAGSFRRAVILKLPLSELAAGQSLNFGVFSTTQYGSLRPVQGAGDTMYFASHGNTTELRIFEWPDNGTTVTTTDVTISPWPNGSRSGWTARSDQRVTAAWQSGDEIGFAWTASAGSGFAHPHIRVAILNRNTKQVLAQPHIWSGSFPYAYPAASPNNDGDVGMAFHFGDDPNHAVAILENNAGVRDWDISTTVTSNRSPNDNKWGDYGAVRADPTRNDGWIATGYTLQGGSSRQSIEPHIVRFSTTSSTPPPPPPPPPPPATLALSIAVDDAGSGLSENETRAVTVRATRVGNPAGGETINLRSLDARLSVAPASRVTGNNGEASFTVTNTSGGRAQVTIEAESGGVVEQSTVRLLPALGVIGTALLALGLLALLARSKRRRI